MLHPVTQKIVQLFESHGNSMYGGEAVTQLEHALQCGALARANNASDELITASLLHDIGHLLHDLPDDASDHGIDDRHELLGETYLSEHSSWRLWNPLSCMYKQKDICVQQRQAILKHCRSLPKLVWNFKVGL